MAVDYVASLKTTRMNAVLTAIDVGTAGKLKLRKIAPGNEVIVTITLNDPCGTVSGDTLTFNATGMNAAASLAGTNTADNAVITDSADNIIISGLSVGVSGSGADVILNSTSITSGQTVTITSATIQHG